MKKYILLLIIPFLSFGQIPTIEELMNNFGPGVAGYWSNDGELLFDGGVFDIKHPDAAKVNTYEYIFGGYGTATMKMTFNAFSDGTMPQIYFDLNNSLLYK